mmetsp:Transcript_10308/g.18363  ORF Transcript_10308/g.18363 Transcript_10308/m.18363 type:complete len:150 (-) Transcript_10308:86-535(-)
MPDGDAIQSNAYQHQACKMFDNGGYQGLSRKWDSEWISAGGIPPGSAWAGFNFKTKQIVTSYELQASICCNGDVDRSPTQWVVEAQEDDAAQWVQISAENGQSWSLGKKQNYTINNPGSYKAYRIRGLARSDRNFEQWAAMQFFSGCPS